MSDNTLSRHRVSIKSPVQFQFHIPPAKVSISRARSLPSREKSIRTAFEAMLLEDWDSDSK